MADTILEVKHLKKYFNTPKGLLHAVDDVNFTLERGKTLGIVGESGCGKSTTGQDVPSYVSSSRPPVRSSSMVRMYVKRIKMSSVS